ncbi:MAG: histidine kinase [Methylophilaceae bacterium]|nr:histidine kinase [Methylophilaceae bacterium]
MPIIKQNSSAISATLPDFQNPGIALRIILIVSALTLAGAVLRADTLQGTWSVLLQFSVFTQPILLMALLSLYILNRCLAKLAYQVGVAMVLVLILLITTGMQYLLAQWLEPATTNLVRSWFFAAAITGVLLLYFNMRSRALSPAITEAKLQALQARIRPHFLFNTINAVLSLIRSEPRRAETALEDMADLFRVLMADNRDLVPLLSELELCRQYLSLEKLRLDDRLRLNWHIDKMPEDALIPPLVLQPLLENAVYHGIEPFQEGGEIQINLYLSRNEVHLVLTNPYRQDGDHHIGNKMALNNIRQRLALHFDAEAHLKTQISADQYQVHIVIPYRKMQAS